MSFQRSVATALTTAASTARDVIADTLRTFHSDEIILHKIYMYHVHDERKIDNELCLPIITHILFRSSRIIENLSRGTEEKTVIVDEHLIPSASFDSPTYILRLISSEMACKSPGPETAHSTTIRIIEILKDYPWEAKAVVAYAAFASDYGKFWNVAHYSTSDQLARSLAILDRVTALKKRLEEHPRYRQLLGDLQVRLNNALEVIKLIQAAKKTSSLASKDFPELSGAISRIPVAVYWVIHALVASTTEMSALIYDEVQPQKYLTDLDEKIISILNDLKKTLDRCQQRLDDLELYRWLVDHIDNTPTEIELVLRKLIYSRNDPNVLIDGSSTQKEAAVYTQKEVDIEVLRGKTVLLLIAGSQISTEDLTVFNQIYDALRGDDRYKIVWLWVSEPHDKLKPVPWYSVPYRAHIPGIRFIEERWQLREDPLVVVMSPQSKVLCSNAIHMIRLWGPEAFPFTNSEAEALLRKKTWIELTALKLADDTRLQEWITQDRYIIIFGGKDSKWLEQFEKKATDFKNNAWLREERTVVEIFRMAKTSRGEDDPNLRTRFWMLVWAVFILKHLLNYTEGAHEILKLLLYKEETGWAVITRGSTVIVAARGRIVETALDEFNNWLEDLRAYGFLQASKGYISKIAQKTHQCERLIIYPFSGWIPEVLHCPDCPRYMETGFSFRCCHGE